MIDLTDSDRMHREDEQSERELPQNQNVTVGGNERENRRGFFRFLSLLTFQCFVVGKKRPFCGLAFRKGGKFFWQGSTFSLT